LPTYLFILLHLFFSLFSFPFYLNFFNSDVTSNSLLLIISLSDTMPVATIIQCYSTFLVMGALIGFFKRRTLPPLFGAVALTIVGFTAAGMENSYPKR
jgi:hypothetical protein